MNDLSLLQILIPFIVGVLAIFIFSQVAARKELELREKGYKPNNYQDKLPREYTKKQKEFTFLIVLFLFSTASLALYLLLNGKLTIASFVIVLGIIIWRVLINFGNRIK